MHSLQYMPIDAANGPRIGGSAPSCIHFDAPLEQLQYFGTFPISENLEFSIFHRFDILGEDAERDVIAHNNKVLVPSDLIFVLVHETSERGDQQFRPFEARGLTLSELPRDELIDEGEAILPYSATKMWGKAHLVLYWLQSAVDNLEQSGYTLMLQIFTHGADIIDEFPWDPGGLFVWAQDPTESGSYRFLIEQ